MAALSKILYVEDEPSIRMIAQIALETVGGFTLRTCSSGREASPSPPTSSCST